MYTEFDENRRAVVEKQLENDTKFWEIMNKTDTVENELKKINEQIGAKPNRFNIYVGGDEEK